MKCPLCSSDSKFIFEVKGYNVLDCVTCAHRFAEIKTEEDHAATTYDDSYFNGGGAGYADYLAQGEMLRKRGTMYSQKIEQFSKKKGKVLDVGAAAGFILKGFVDDGWQGIGVDPNPKVAEYGRKEFGLDIKHGAFEKFHSDQKFDLITMIQVVPHLYEQHGSFKNASKLLSKDGLLLIETWNRDSKLAKLFGKNWHEYAPPSVLHYFSKKGLTNFVEEFGFKKVESGRPLKKITGKHAKSLLKYKLGDTILLKLIPEKISFPYPSEDLFWVLFRKV